MEGEMWEVLRGRGCALCRAGLAGFICKECWAFVCCDCVCVHNQGPHRCLPLGRLLPLFKESAEELFQRLSRRAVESTTGPAPRDISELPEYELLIDGLPPAATNSAAELENERMKNSQLKAAIQALQGEKLLAVENCRRETARLTRLVQELRPERRGGSDRTERLFSGDDHSIQS